MLSVEKTSPHASKLTVLGWWGGLGWYAYEHGIDSLRLYLWLILFFGGMLIVAPVIAGGIAFLLGALTRLIYGDWKATSALYFWGHVLGPAIAFLCASPAIGVADKAARGFGGL